MNIEVCNGRERLIAEQAVLAYREIEAAAVHGQRMAALETGRRGIVLCKREAGKPADLRHWQQEQPPLARGKRPIAWPPWLPAPQQPMGRILEQRPQAASVVPKIWPTPRSPGEGYGAATDR